MAWIVHGPSGAEERILMSSLAFALDRLLFGAIRASRCKFCLLRHIALAVVSVRGPVLRLYVPFGKREATFHLVHERLTSSLQRKSRGWGKM